MIKLRKFTAEEELYLRRDLDGIYLLEMTGLLWKLMKILEENGDLSDELKERITSLKDRVENETVGLNEALEIWEELEKEMRSYYNQKKFEADFSMVLNLSKELKDKFKEALNVCVEKEDFAKMQRLCGTFQKIAIIVDLTKNRVISPKVAMNLRNLTFENEIMDSLVVQATMRNEEFTGSQIYLKGDIKLGEECDFAVLVLEDNDYFMVSYNSDGSIKFKEKVILVPIKRDYVGGYLEVVDSQIKARDYRSYYPIETVFDKDNAWKYKASLNNNSVKVTNMNTGEEFLVVGSYNWHDICLINGFLSMRPYKAVFYETNATLGYTDSFLLDKTTLGEMLQAQMLRVRTLEKSKNR